MLDFLIDRLRRILPNRDVCIGFYGFDDYSGKDFDFAPASVTRSGISVLNVDGVDFGYFGEFTDIGIGTIVGKNTSKYARPYTIPTLSPTVEDIRNSPVLILSDGRVFIKPDFNPSKLENYQRLRYLYTETRKMKSKL